MLSNSVLVGAILFIGTGLKFDPVTSDRLVCVLAVAEANLAPRHLPRRQLRSSNLLPATVSSHSYNRISESTPPAALGDQAKV